LNQNNIAERSQRPKERKKKDRKKKKKDGPTYWCVKLSCELGTLRKVVQRRARGQTPAKRGKKRGIREWVRRTGLVCAYGYRDPSEVRMEKKKIEGDRSKKIKEEGGRNKVGGEEKTGFIWENENKIHLKKLARPPR